jgi:hypothetical protein
MTLHFLSASKLVEDLAHEQLSPRDKAYYMLAGFIFSIVVGYSTLTSTNAGRTWLGLYEFLLLVVIAVYGFERSYSASNGDNGRSFISDFVCLSLPIGVTTTLVAWGIYWGGWKLYQHIVLAISFESQRVVNTIVLINNELPWATVMVAMVLSNGIFYLRMVSHLKRLKILRQHA